MGEVSVSPAMRFENALSLALLRADGWLLLSGGSLLPEERGRVLAGGQGALLVLLADGLSMAQVRDQKYRVTCALAAGGAGVPWRTFSLLFVFQDGCGADMRSEVLRDEPAASLVEMTIQSGFVDLREGLVSLRPGQGVPSLSLLEAAVARARAPEPDAEIDDGEAYRRAVIEEELRKERFYRGVRGTVPWATGVIITVCVAMFAWTMVRSGEGGPSVAVLWQFGACEGSLVRAGETWRLLAALFLHGGWLHLVANMYSLWIVGPMVERFLGTLKYLVLFCLAGLVASLASAQGGAHLSVGASGAIFGLLGGMVGSLLRFGREIPASLRSRLLRGFGVTIALNLALGFYLAGGGGVQIDNWAHLGGVVGGLVFGLLVRPGSLDGERAWTGWRRVAHAAVVGAMILVAVAPFAVEGFVAHRVLRASTLWSETYVYGDASGVFVVEVPLPLQRAQEEPTGVAFVSEDGMELSVSVTESAGGREGLEACFADVVKALESDEVTLEAQGVETVGGRTWRRVRGRMRQGGQLVEVAMAMEGSLIYRVQMQVPPSLVSRGHQAMRTVMGSLRLAH